MPNFFELYSLLNENEQAMLRAIQLNPTDATKLVYADWLEERGDPKGELIRLQVLLTNKTELAKYLKENPNMPYQKLKHREQQLVDDESEKHGQFSSYFQHYKGLGYISLRASNANYLENHPEIQEAYIHNINNIEEILPYLKNLIALLLWYQLIGDKNVITLVKSPYIENLKELNLRNTGISDNSIIALANSPYMENLRELDIIGNNNITNINALINSPYLKLKILYINKHLFNNEDIKLLEKKVIKINTN